MVRDSPVGTAVSAHLLLHGPAINTPWTTTGPQPGGWGPLLYKILSLVGSPPSPSPSSRPQRGKGVRALGEMACAPSSVRSVTVLVVLAHSPASHHPPRRPVPSRPWSGTAPWPRGWVLLLFTLKVSKQKLRKKV